MTHKVHATLLKWLKSHLRLHGNLILWSRFPHLLAPITLAGISLHILMKSEPIVAYLQDFEGSPLCCKISSTRPVMTGQENVKNFLLPNTSSQDLIWARYEEIAPIQVKGVLFLTILLFSFEDRCGGNCAEAK